MRTLRQIIFYIFLLGYLIAMPTAILYALGYIWAPGSDRGLVRSGLIALTSTPDDAQIHLGNSRYTRRTPATIRDLLPGAYTIRLTRNDCEAWQRDIAVEAERATVLDRIILLSVNRAPQSLDPRPWRNLRSEAGERHLVLESPDTLGHWATLDADEGILSPLLATNSIWSDARVLQSWFINGSPHALLRIEREDHEYYLWFTLNSKENDPMDITRLFPDAPDDVIWDPRGHRELYARIGSRTHRLDLKEMTIFPDCAPPAKGIALLRGHLYTITESNTLLRVASDGAAEETDYALPTAISDELSGPCYTPFLLPNDGVLVSDANGALWLNNPPQQLAPQGLLTILADDKDDRWLIATETAIGLLELAPQSKSDEFALRWIHTQRPPINRAAWIHDDTHILFSSQGNLMLLALERGGGGAPRLLGPCNATGDFFFSEHTGFLYALNPDNRLTRTRLLPPRSLIPLPLHSESDK